MDYIFEFKKIIFKICFHIGLYNRLEDKEYLKLKYKRYTKLDLNIECPQTYNEKLQWLKLYNRNSLYTTLVDKYAVREYIKKKIGEEYLIPLIGGPWKTVDEISFDTLPEQFVLKTTHDSGGVLVCKNKNTFDVEKAKKSLKKNLKKNFYYSSREWPYKDVKPMIIAEQYMEDESEKELKDYKIFNFNGKARIIQVDFGRFTNHKRNLYSTDWEYIEMKLQYPNDPQYKIEKPKRLDKMLELAEILSDGMPHVRTDFYLIGEKIYFGELTFYHGGGFEKFDPPKWDRILGDWLVLPEKKRAWANENKKTS